MNIVGLIALALKVKEGLHPYRGEVPGPRHGHLNLLDAFSHEVSSKEEADLRVELFLTDFSNEATELIDLNLFSCSVGCHEWGLDTTVLEHDVARAHFEEDILLGFPWEVSLLKGLAISGRSCDVDIGIRVHVFLLFLLLNFNL